MFLGVIAALIGGLIGANTRWWYYLVAAVCLVLGLKDARSESGSISQWYSVGYVSVLV